MNIILNNKFKNNKFAQVYIIMYGLNIINYMDS